MAEKVIFGKAETFEQALVRLPPKGDMRGNTDEMLADLSMLRRCIEEGFDIVPVMGSFDFETRICPIGEEALVRMEITSFRRNLLEPILVSYEFIRHDNPWAMVLDSGDDAYVTWRVTNLLPTKQLKEGKLVCIEAHPHMYTYVKDIPKNPKENECSIGWVKDDELYELVEELTRNNLGLV